MDWHAEDGDQLSDSIGERPAVEPSTRVAYRLADESGRAIDDLRPLADSIDPEALDALFEHRSAEHAAVRFRHEGYSVTVTGGGDVRIDPVDGG